MAKKLQEIAAVVAERNGMGQRAAERFVASFFQLIREGLAAERTVKVKGLGTFKIIDVEERESVNVTTGRRFTISGHNKLTFTPEQSLKDLVNKPFSQFETVVLNDGVDFKNIEVEDRPEPVKKAVIHASSFASTQAEETEEEAPVEVKKPTKKNKATAEEKVTKTRRKKTVAEAKPEPVAVPEPEPEPVEVVEPVVETAPEPIEEPAPEHIEVVEPVVETEPEPVDEPEEEPILEVFDDPNIAKISDEENDQILKALAAFSDDEEEAPKKKEPTVIKNAEEESVEPEPIEEVAPAEPEPIIEEIVEEKVEEPLSKAVETVEETVETVEEKVEEPLSEAVETIEETIENPSPRPVNRKRVVERREPEVEEAEQVEFERPTRVSGRFQRHNQRQRPERQTTLTPEEEYGGRQWVKFLPWIIALLVCAALSFMGGYILGKRSVKPAEETVLPVAKPTPIEAPQPIPVAPMEGEKVADESVATPVESPKEEQTTEKTDEGDVDYKKYEKMDYRVRKGAYRIVGTAFLETVREGDNTVKIAKRTLGKEMECYIEVYNGITADTELVPGQKLKIPKVVNKMKTNK